MYERKQFLDSACFFYVKCCLPSETNIYKKNYLNMLSNWSWSKSAKSAPWMTIALANFGSRSRAGTRILSAISSMVSLSLFETEFVSSESTIWPRINLLNPYFQLPSEMMPTVLAIALAVMGWSPVTMTTRMPAERQRRTAPGTAARGGSIIAISPTNRKFWRGKLTFSMSNLYPSGNSDAGRW